MSSLQRNINWPLPDSATESQIFETYSLQLNILSFANQTKPRFKLTLSGQLEPVQCPAQGPIIVASHIDQDNNFFIVSLVQSTDSRFVIIYEDKHADNMQSLVSI